MSKTELILHPTIYLKNRGHQIDMHVYEPCARLWENGIKTFFSCQGGPQMQDGRLIQKRAYVVVKRKDAKKACKVLKDLNPKIDDNLLYKRISIKFDASEAAKSIPLIVEETRIRYKILRKGV